MGDNHRVCEICGVKERHIKEELYFARFPLNESRCREWVKVVGKEELTKLPIKKLNQLKRICAKHFKISDFRRGSGRLNGKAIPTQNLILPSINNNQTKTSNNEQNEPIGSKIEDLHSEMEGVTQNRRHKESQLKKQRENQKDHYKKEVKKFPVIRSGMGGEFVSSTWQYYESMTFQNDDVIPEPTGGNLDTGHDDVIEGDNDNVSEDVDRMTDMSTATTSLSSRRRNKSAAEVRDEFLELENKKNKLLETKYTNEKTSDDMEKDDDYHFFMSLIPPMKEFTNIQKLRIRNKITKIIIDEAEMYTLR